MKKYKIGIALSGGGVRGFAHLGVLQALNERGIFPEIVSGTSAGSIAGAFYCAGYSPHDALEIMKTKKFSDFTKIHIPKDGFFGLENLKLILENNIKQLNFEDLNIPLYVCVSNLNTGKVEYVNKGPLHDMILASSAIPVVFSPVKIGKTYYVDGGLIDNLPVKPLVRLCDDIITVNVFPNDENQKFDSLLQVAIRSFQMNMNNNIKYIKSKSTVFLEPAALSKYHILKTKYQEEIFEIGYKYAKKAKFELS